MKAKKYSLDWWFKVFATTALALFLLLVVFMIALVIIQIYS